MRESTGDLVRLGGSQNDPVFHVEMTKIEFPLMFLLLKMAGGKCLKIVGPCDKMRGHKAMSYNMCATA